MKKMIVVCMLVAAVGMSQANLVNNGDFDGNVAGWTFTANQSGYNATHDVAFFGWTDARSIYQNTGAVFQADTVYTMTVLITSPTTNNTNQYRGAQLVMYAPGSGLGDVRTLDYLFPAEDRLTQTGTVGTYREVTMTLDTAVDTGVVGYQIAVGIRGLVGDGSWGPAGWMYVRSIELVEAPDVRRPHTPTPVSGAIDAGIASATPGKADILLQWKPGLDPENPEEPYSLIRQYYLYMSADQNKSSDPNLYYKDIIGAGDPIDPDPQYGPLELNLDGKYLWRVDTGIEDDGVTGLDDPNTIIGSTWSFDVLKSVPVLTAQPADVLLDVTGGAAEFSVTASSISPGSYTWYWSSDVLPVLDPETNSMVPIGVALNSGIFFPPGGTATLAVNNVQLTDVGYYYCKVWNAAGESEAAYSNVVRLGVKQLMAHWTLDTADFVNNQYLDVSGNENHADPNYPGAVGDAWVDGIAGEGVAINESTWANAGSWRPGAHTNQMTISVWVKVTGTLANLHGIVSKRTDATTAEWGLFARSGDGTHPGTNYVRFLSWQGGGQLWSDQNALVPNEWVHVVATVDASRISRLYINGVQQSQGANWVFGDGTSAPILLGKIADHNLFPGQLDDIQMWNYAKDRYGVVDL